MNRAFQSCGRSAFLLAALSLPTPLCFAQEKPGPVAVHEGAAVTLKGKVQGYNGAAYSVYAEAGQQLQASLQTQKGATMFNVYAPGNEPGQEALFRGDVGGNIAKVKVTQTGEYRIEVYQMRSFARRGTVANFSLTIALRR